MKLGIKIYIEGISLRAAHLRGDLEHQEDLQALHVNAAIQQLHSLVEVILSGQWNHQLQEEKTTLLYFFILFHSISNHVQAVKASYFIVGVVKVHRLTESHFSFRLQVVQLDRSRELQDPTEKKRGRRSGGHRDTHVCIDNNVKVVNLVEASPLLPFELKLYSDIVLLERQSG